MSNFLKNKTLRNFKKKTKLVTNTDEVDPYGLYG